MRQWLLSLPWNLRLLAAYDHDLVLGRPSAEQETVPSLPLVRSLTTWQRPRASRPNLSALPTGRVPRPCQGAEDAQCGAVTQIQRFAADLALNPHLHLLAPDGVFHRPDPEAPPVFRRLPAPTDHDVCEVVAGRAGCTAL